MIVLLYFCLVLLMCYLLYKFLDLIGGFEHEIVTLIFLSISVSIFFSFITTCSVVLFMEVFL